MSRERKHSLTTGGWRRVASDRMKPRPSRQIYSAPVKQRTNGETERPDPVILTPWEAFQEHLRSIDDNSAMYTYRNPAPDGEKDKGRKREDADGGEGKTTEEKAMEMAQQLSVAIKLKNSDAFLKTMQELQLRRQQQIERQAAIQREREGDEGMTSEILNEDAGEDWSDVEEGGAGGGRANNKKDVILKAAARRGWAKIRRYIGEKAMEQKQKNSAMNWSFLRQTISNMTDLEKGRQNLYERYLINPDSWKHGFTNFPNELFDKERVRERRMYGSQPNLKRTNNNRHKKTKSPRSISSVKTH